MRKEEYSKSSQDLNKKFHEWFEDGVPASIPIPAEADHASDPVPVVLPLPADADHLNRRKIDNPLKLFWL